MAGKNKDGLLETQNLLITAVALCGKGTGVDTVYVQAGQTRVIDLLMNDFFCDTEFVSAVISESIRGGEAGILTYSVDTGNNRVTLTFQAENKPGQYLYSAYNLGVNPSLDPGAVTFDWRDDQEKFERFYTALVNFIVIE